MEMTDSHLFPEQPLIRAREGKPRCMRGAGSGPPAPRGSAGGSALLARSSREGHPLCTPAQPAGRPICFLLAGLRGTCSSGNPPRGTAKRGGLRSHTAFGRSRRQDRDVRAAAPWGCSPGRGLAAFARTKEDAVGRSPLAELTFLLGAGAPPPSASGSTQRDPVPHPRWLANTLSDGTGGSQRGQGGVWE